MFGISVGARKPCWAAPAFSEVQFPEERIKYTLPDMSHQESEIMPHYISLVNWTEQGVRNVKESPKRADAANAMASKLGAKMDIFYTMGKYDLVVVTQAPNDETAMQIILELGKMGNIRTNTLKAWTAAEATKVIAKLQ
jgi:uncharacterized protein with GYD domain